MITANPCGFVYNNGNVAPAQALVLHLKNSKREYGINSELPLIRLFAKHVTVIIKSARFFVIIVLHFLLVEAINDCRQFE